MARRPLPRHGRIANARPDDLDAIIEIERLSFSSPWSRQIFIEEFARDFAFLKVLRHDDSGQVIAFINYWMVHDEVHILNVATHPDHRRQGLARRLMLSTLRRARLHHSRLITLEVRRSNLPALELYRRLGFVPVGVRPRYYENQEDAIVMLLQLRPDADD